MGYEDTKEKIISTLMGRPSGTEIQPENQQDYALSMLEYIRSIELISNSSLIGIANEETVPVQPNDSRVSYISGIAQNRTMNFRNFIGQNGESLSVTTGDMECYLIILLWNTEYWSLQAIPSNIISQAENATFYYRYNIRKTYNSVASMNADSENPIGTDGKPINIGDIVSVVNTGDSSENAIYSRTEDGWQFQSGMNFALVQETGTDPNVAMSQDAVTKELVKLESNYNSKVFTTNVNANKVIRKLYIDTSGYTGDLSLDGLKLSIIAKNVGSLWGIQLKNSQNETVTSPWMNSERAVQMETSSGIFFYVEYNWENMTDGQLSGAPFELTNEVFNKANEPRSSIVTDMLANNSVIDKKIANGAVTEEKISDNAVSTNKIANKAVSEDKLSDEIVTKLNSPSFQDNSIDFIKMKLTPNFLNFNAGNLFNVLDYEGFNSNPTVWTTTAGTGISPIITIEEQPNILGLKYSRCFEIKDELYKGNYYDAPYFILRLEALKGIKTKSFCFYINIKNFEGINRRLFSAFNGTSNQVAVDIRWGTDTHKENSLSVAGTTSYLSVDIFYITYNGEKWAFVRGKFWVDDVSVVQNDIPTFLMGFVGGEEHVGEKTITCGWTFVSGDIELLPFQYYPYNKNFFELFTESGIPDDSISTDKIEDNAVTTSKIANGAVTEEKINENVNLSKTTVTGGLYGQAGDSISEGAGLQTTLDPSDPYNPISGTKKATYGYYIAKLNRMRWANYGISGSTLGFVVANGSDKNGFSKENGRYTQMDNNLTHLSIFFGWNDSYYGPIMKKEDWLFDTYSTKIYFPRTTDLIGKTADDGTPYATQEQYDALKQVTGNVGGVEYDNSEEYFQALYVGTENDSTNKTFWGAWNIVLPYVINKYPLAKILLIVPFGCYALLRQCVRDAAKKYGLATYDFSDINNQMFRQWEDNPARGMVNGKTISQFRIDSLTYDGLHPNKEGYEYMYPSINSKIISL